MYNSKQKPINSDHEYNAESSKINNPINSHNEINTINFGHGNNNASCSNNKPLAVKYAQSSKLDFMQSSLNQFEIRNPLSLDAPLLANLQLYLVNTRLYLTIYRFTY